MALSIITSVNNGLFCDIKTAHSSVPAGHDGDINCSY